MKFSPLLLFFFLFCSESSSAQYNWELDTVGFNQSLSYRISTKSADGTAVVIGERPVAYYYGSPGEAVQTFQKWSEANQQWEWQGSLWYRKTSALIAVGNKWIAASEKWDNLANGPYTLQISDIDELVWSTDYKPNWPGWYNTIDLVYNSNQNIIALCHSEYTDSTKLMSSSDIGETWNEIEHFGLEDLSLPGGLVHVNGKLILWGDFAINGGLNRLIYESFDEGVNWSEIQHYGTDAPLGIVDIDVDTSGNIYLLQTKYDPDELKNIQKLHKSEDEGYNWVEMNVNPLDLLHTYALVVGDENIFIVGDQEYPAKMIYKKKLAYLNPIIHDFEVYPNPATNEMNLSINIEMDARIPLRFYAMTGELCKEAEVILSNGKGIFDISTLNAGMYFVQLNLNEFSKTVKIIKL